MIIFLIIVFVLLNYTRFGRHVYAIGGNEESTMMSGVNVKKNLIWSYVVSGIGAGLAAVDFVLLVWELHIQRRVMTI